MDPSSRALILYFIIFLQSFSGLVQSYENYTVGDSLGWYDTLENPDVDYDKWASSKNFSLGDFLIFNTDNNHSVIQTYNFTTYKLCDYDDSTDNDTIQWSSVNPSSTNPQQITVSVPLVRVGMTYFFSSDYDGEQCNYGQHLKINVTYGQGLPPNLGGASEESPGPVSPESGDDDNDEAAPDTLVPANFDHPKDTSDDVKESSSSVSLFAFSKFWRLKLYCMLFMFGLLCLGY